MQLTDYQNALGAEFGFKGSGNDLVQMNRVVNQGVREVLKRTHCHQEHVALDLAAGAQVGDWTIASPSPAPIAMLELYTPGTPLRFIKEVSARELLMRRQTITNTEGPYYYHWAGEELLMFAPASSTKPVLTALLVPYPTALSAGSDDPATNSKGGIPEELQEAVYTWACWKLSRIEGLPAPKTPKDYYEMFVGQIGEARHHLRQRGSRRMNPGRVGYPQTSIGRRNDAYPPR